MSLGGGHSGSGSGHSSGGSSGGHSSGGSGKSPIQDSGFDTKVSTETVVQVIRLAGAEADMATAAADQALVK